MSDSTKSTAFISELIYLYKQLPYLWKIKSKWYSDRRKQNNVYENY